MSYFRNFYQFITQTDEVCLKCGKELPTGSQAWGDEDGEHIYCEKCMPDGEAYYDYKREQGE